MKDNRQLMPSNLNEKPIFNIPTVLRFDGCTFREPVNPFVTASIMQRKFMAYGHVCELANNDIFEIKY